MYKDTLALQRSPAAVASHCFATPDQVRSLPRGERPHQDRLFDKSDPRAAIQDLPSEFFITVLQSSKFSSKSVIFIFDLLVLTLGATQDLFAARAAGCFLR